MLLLPTTPMISASRSTTATTTNLAVAIFVKAIVVVFIAMLEWVPSRPIGTTSLQSVHAFGNFVLPKKLFGTNFLSTDSKTGTSTTTTTSKQIEMQKNQLLTAITGTNNGKTATSQQQLRILQLVRQLEKLQPNISITNPKILQQLNGTWYLQYTSPSSIESIDSENITIQQMDETFDIDKEDILWQPKDAQLENVETKAFRAKGTVSAAGITLDTSNKLVQQIFNVQTNTVLNQITFDDTGGRYGIAGGTYRPSTIQPNRAIVAFNQAKIIVPIPIQQLLPTKTNQTTTTITINLGWIFTLIALLRKGNRDNGWLETTYIDDTFRIGRGNKGTMFILTREPLSL